MEASLESALILVVRKANTEVERTRRIAGMPYSGHDALCKYWMALGRQQGAHEALEALDRTMGQKVS